MTHGVARPLALLTLPLLLFACGQTPQAAVDPYAGADHPWSYTAPGGRVAALTLTPGWNTLQYETPTFMTNGWGPVEKNRSNGENRGGDGQPLTLNGVTYAQGFGVHSLSELTFDLQGTYGAGCTRLAVNIGLDDEVGTRGSVVFQVYADGDKLYDSGVMTGASATRRVDLDISGRRELRLEVTDAGDGKSYDHADWADPRVLCAAGTAGTPGALDSEFQRVTPPIGTFEDAVGTTQPDGKILIFAFDRGRTQYLLARYNADGTPDLGFGQRGRVALSLGTRNVVKKVVVQADGKIVTLSQSNYPTEDTFPQVLLLLRFLPDGRSDPTFGQGGLVSAAGLLIGTSAGALYGGQDLEVQPDGKLLVTNGYLYANALGVARFLPSGTLDSGFGQAGIVQFPLGLPLNAETAFSYTQEIEVQPDGGIVVAGNQVIDEVAYTYTRTVFARLLPNGRPDPSFGKDGLAVGRTERFFSPRLDGLVIQPDGRLLTVSTSFLGRCVLDRLKADGSPDATFAATGDLGFNLSNLFTPDQASLVLQPDGKVLTAGCSAYTPDGVLTRRLLTRTLPGGQPDPTFGNEVGQVVVEDNRSVLLQPDGKIVVGLNPGVRLFP